MSKGNVILFILILLTGGGTFLYVNWGGVVDKSLTEPYVAPDLTVEEIRTKIFSGEFKQRLEAQKQINKLEPEEKLRVLLKLANDADAKARLIAVKNLRKVDRPEAREKLAWMAKNDPDETVRDVAGAE